VLSHDEERRHADLRHPCFGAGEVGRSENQRPHPRVAGGACDGHRGAGAGTDHPEPVTVHLVEALDGVEGGRQIIDLLLRRRVFFRALALTVAREIEEECGES
jgi:hypothetical protein